MNSAHTNRSVLLRIRRIRNTEMKAVQKVRRKTHLLKNNLPEKGRSEFYPAVFLFVIVSRLKALAGYLIRLRRND